MITYNKISKSYQDKILFNKLTIQIDSGSKTVIHAPSGSGKTTLIKMLLGFDTPDSGSISIDNQVLDKHSLHNIRKKIAYVSQDADLNLNTIDIILDEIFNYKVNKHITNYQQQFVVLAREFGLDHKTLHQHVNQLSGGERQRVSLIIALLLDRDIIILDEITSGLDTDLTQCIINYILKLEKTVLIISHDPQWLESDQVKVVTL